MSEPGAPTDADRLVVKASPYSVADTVDRLTAEVAGRGMKLFTVIDHSGEAAAVGLPMPDTKVVVFGNPRAGTPMMLAAPLAALDLPLKVLVWQDGTETRLAYTAPAILAARHALSDELAAPLAGVDVVTDAAIATD